MYQGRVDRTLFDTDEGTDADVARSEFSNTTGKYETYLPKPCILVCCSYHWGRLWPEK